MAGTTLLITEDATLLRQVQGAFDELGEAVSHVRDVGHALELLQNSPPELVVCEFEAFERLRQERPGLYAVLVAEGGDSDLTIESMKRGALDCLVRPLRHADTVHCLREALRVCRDARVAVAPKSMRAPQPAVRLIGQSPAMQEVYKQIGLLAPRDINVLITGESGTGKELIARSLYEHSRRSGKPYLEVNCAAIPETLLESELFGHEKGAFTGADARRIGKFEQCDGGTLFLDEVGDMPASTQAKLLRVLQEGAFQRVGGNSVIKVDVRIISATHQPLEEMVREKRFRGDLYYRLKVATITVPPLREREVDAVLLAHYFVDRLYQAGQTEVRSFTPETVSALLAYDWPGNVRELENVIKAAAVVARGPVFRVEFLPEHVQAARRAAPRTDGEPMGPMPRRVAGESHRSLKDLAAWLVADGAPHGQAYAVAVAAAEKAVILAALDRVNGRLTRAATLLGISRTTLRAKMREHGVVVRLQANAAEV